MTSLAHVTLATGHVRGSPRSEVAPPVIDLLAPLLASAIAGREVDVPGPGDCTMTVAAGGDCALATVWAEDGAALATIGLARGPDEAAALWRMLHETAIGIEPVTHAELPPSPPWCAARIEVGLALHPEAAHWLGDFERCLAWTWIERGEPRRERLTRPLPGRRARGPRMAAPHRRRRE